MAQRKPYNPNTAYGRKKIREQNQEYYNNLPPSKKTDNDMMKVGCLLIVVTIVLIIGFMTNNMKGALKWLSH